MLTIHIPGLNPMQIKNLVLDYNGTIACDGKLIQQVVEPLNILANHIKIYILTADTFGESAQQTKKIKGQLHILTSESGTAEKANFIEKLGAEYTVAIGNGANDSLMLAKSALGIGVIGPEGAAVQTIKQADVVVNHINDALNLLLEPKRLIATLRK